MMKVFVFLALPLICSCANLTSASAAGTPITPCLEDPNKQLLRSAELQQIVKADQDDREGPFDKIDWPQVSQRDEARRKRVGEILGEGCFKTAADYSAAALVFQHGDNPDQFFLTFVWAKKAVELGDESQSRLLAMGIDRYLTKSGHKQLFGTQATKSDSDPCWCLEDIEPSFPAEVRLKFWKKTIADQMAWVNSLNENSPKCKAANFCSKILKKSPAGTVPGFW